MFLLWFSPGALESEVPGKIRFQEGGLIRQNKNMNLFLFLISYQTKNYFHPEFIHEILFSTCRSIAKEFCMHISKLKKKMKMSPNVVGKDTNDDLQNKENFSKKFKSNS